MATIKISQLPPPPNGTGSGTPQGTDLVPATDTTDTTSAASGTTKKYTQSSILNFYLEAQGLTTYAAARVGTTTALTVTYSNGASGVGATLTNTGTQAALAIDGVTLSVGDRVLVKNQAAQLQNGIYTVTSVGSGSTNWVITRATDYDQTADIVQYGVVLVNQGTVNAGLLYQETAAAPITIGTDAITFVAYSASYASGSVASITGTANQVIASASTGAVTLSLPQSIATTSAVSFGTISSGASGGGGLGTFIGYSSTANLGFIALRAQNNSGNFANIITNIATTGSRTWSFPDASGTVALTSGASGIVNSGTTSQLAYYASSGTTLSGLSTANNGLLVTNGSGVPSIGNTINDSITVVGNVQAGNSGNAGQFNAFPATASRGVLVFKCTNNAADRTNIVTNASTGQNTTWTIPDPGASTANFILSAGTQSIGPGLTLTTPVIGAASATSVAFTSTSGIIGTTTNDSAAAGSVGEEIQSIILSGSGGVTLTTETALSIGDITLDNGDWDIWGNIVFSGNTALLNITEAIGGISTTDDTLPDVAYQSSINGVTTDRYGAPLPCYRVSLTSSTTFYLVAYATFAAGGVQAYGGIYARRRR